MMHNYIISQEWTNCDLRRNYVSKKVRLARSNNLCPINWHHKERTSDKNRVSVADGGFSGFPKSCKTNIASSGRSRGPKCYAYARLYGNLHEKDTDREHPYRTAQKPTITAPQMRNYLLLGVISELTEDSSALLQQNGISMFVLR